MSDSDSKPEKPPAGTIGWIDMAVENADQIRGFYESVVGWASEAVPVEDHQDFVITPAGVPIPLPEFVTTKAQTRTFLAAG